LAGGPEFVEGGKDLPGARPHGDAVSQIDPTNYAACIDQKLRRPCNVRSFRSRPGMQHIVPANDLRFWIGKQRKRITELLRLPLINLRRIDADADNANAARVEFGKPLLKTP
jgi:hypothetical protein